MDPNRDGDEKWRVHPGNRRKFSGILVGLSALVTLSTMTGYAGSGRETIDLVRLVSGSVLAEGLLLLALTVLIHKG